MTWVWISGIHVHEPLWRWFPGHLTVLLGDAEEGIKEAGVGVGSLEAGYLSCARTRHSPKPQ